MSEIYGITKESKIVYVGQTTRGYETRFGEHKKKMGLDESYGVELIKNCPENELDKWERHYIKKYDTLKNGMNKQEGGKAARGYSIPPRIQSEEERSERSRKMKIDNPLFCEKARKNKSDTMKRLYSSGELPNPNSKSWTIDFGNGRTEVVFALKKWCAEKGYSYRNVYNAFSRNHSHRDIVSVSRN